MSDQRLFVSHASEDGAVAERIVAYLESHGAPCWISSRDIPPRAIYADAITAAMQECSACIVLVSAASNASKAVKRELELASHYDKPFIPIRTDTTEPAAGVDYYLRNTQWVDYARDGERALARIIGAGAAAPIPRAGMAQPPPRPAAPMQQTQAGGGARSGLIVGGVAAALLAAAGIYFATRPQAESVAENAATPQAAAAFLLGDFHWEGLACGQGPHVEMDGDELVFTTPDGPAYRHRIEAPSTEIDPAYSAQISTRVAAPEDHAGEAYVIRQRASDGVIEIASGERTDEWQRCGAASATAPPSAAAFPSLADSYWIATWGPDDVRVPWHFYADGRACGIYDNTEVCDWRWAQDGDAVTIRSGGETWSGRFDGDVVLGQLRQGHGEEMQAIAAPKPFRLERRP